MSHAEYVTMLWPIMLVLMMILDAKLRRRWERRATFWKDTAELQMAVMKECISDNKQAYELMSKALKYMVDNGDSPDDYLDWMKRSMLMSETWQRRARKIVEMAETAP